MTDALLEVRNLTVRFADEPPAVDEVAFSVPRGASVAVVGESGSGKSALALALLRLLQAPGRVTAGEAWFDGTDLMALPESEMRRFRGAGLGLVSSERTLALSPVHTVGWHVTAPLRFRERSSVAALREHAIELLRKVEMPAPAEHVDAYPHQLSFGMRQRVSLAMALAARPRLLIADEPTTRLDPPLAAQIVDLFRRLVREQETTSLLLMTNELGLACELASELVLLHRGRVVEVGPTSSVCSAPQHPYTRMLLEGAPRARARLATLALERPAPPAGGCRFSQRCPLRNSDPARFPRCELSEPTLEPEAARHRARCFYPSLLPEPHLHAATE